MPTTQTSRVLAFGLASEDLTCHLQRCQTQEPEITITLGACSQITRTSLYPQTGVYGP